VRGLAVRAPVAEGVADFAPKLSNKLKCQASASSSLANSSNEEVERAANTFRKSDLHTTRLYKNTLFCCPVSIFKQISGVGTFAGLPDLKIENAFQAPAVDPSRGRRGFRFHVILRSDRLTSRGKIRLTNRRSARLLDPCLLVRGLMKFCSAGALKRKSDAKLRIDGTSSKSRAGTEPEGFSVQFCPAWHGDCLHANGLLGSKKP
jgi:hypothetical protein